MINPNTILLPFDVKDDTPYSVPGGGGQGIPPTEEESDELLRKGWSEAPEEIEPRTGWPKNVVESFGRVRDDIASTYMIDGDVWRYTDEGKVINPGGGVQGENRPYEPLFDGDWEFSPGVTPLEGANKWMPPQETLVAGPPQVDTPQGGNTFAERQNMLQDEHDYFTTTDVVDVVRSLFPDFKSPSEMSEFTLELWFDAQIFGKTASGKDPRIGIPLAIAAVAGRRLLSPGAKKLVRHMMARIDGIKEVATGGMFGKAGQSFDGGNMKPKFGDPIDPLGPDAVKQMKEWMAKKSGYDSYKLMKKEIFEKWPEKDWLKARELWEGELTNYVGYAEHLTAKASKKLRRETIAKKNPTFSPKQIDAELAKKSKNTFDMDWNWDKEWIDEKGNLRTDGLNKGDRNAPENMSLLFNDRLKSVKDQLENVGYGSEESPGILWGTPAIRDKNGKIIKAGVFRDPDKRFLIKFEDPAKRKIKKGFLRQNPGDAVIYRASNGKIVGKIGQYLDVLYPKNTRHPQTGQIVNTALDTMKKGVAKTVNPDTGKYFTDLEEFREFILNERLKIILRDTNTLPSNITARNRYIDKEVMKDMTKLRKKYPWLPEPPAIRKQIEADPGMSDAALDRRTQTPKGPFTVRKVDQFNPQNPEFK